MEGMNEPVSLDGPPPRPEGGSFEGHLLPGSLFLIWSTYWLFSILRAHALQRRAPQHPHHPQPPPRISRPWYPWPCWPGPLVEPVCKLVFASLGALVELRLGHGEWRRLYKSDGSGHLEKNHLNNWQHALMYGGMAVSGAVDLIGYVVQLPLGTEQAFLGIAFLGETLLMGLHMKPNPFDSMVHLLLTSLMVSSSLVCFAELAAPSSTLLALARPLVVALQGSWFIEAGHMLFHGVTAWDMRDHAALMFAPVAFTFHIFSMACTFLAAYLVSHAIGSCVLGPATGSAASTARGGGGAANGHVAYAPLGNSGFLTGAELELAGLDCVDVDDRVLLAADRDHGGSGVHGRGHADKLRGGAAL